MSEKLKQMTISNHISDLKKRLIYVIFSFLSFALFSYLFVEEIYNFLLIPLKNAYGSDLSNKKLIFTNLTELFFVYIKLCLYTGFALSIPVIIYNFYKFCSPGLYKKERVFLIPILLFSPVLFLMGASLAYYQVIPLAWKFFIGFEQTNSDTIAILLEAKVSEYLNLIMTFIMAFGIAFQIPIILTLMTFIGFIDDKFLIEKRRYAIILMFILGAILTPPDIISQIALAVPMILLYESTIIFIKYFMPKGAKNA